MSVIKFIRDIARYFKYPSDDQPTTQQEYQNAVKNWVATEESLVDSVLWQPTTRYDTGNVVKTPSIPSQYYLICTTAGTSGDSEPTYTDVSVGDSVSDGSVTWRVDKAVTTQTEDKEFSIVSLSTDSNAGMGFGMASTEPLARLCDTGVHVGKRSIHFFADKNETFQIHSGGATTFDNNFFVGGTLYNTGGLVRVGTDTSTEPTFGGWISSTDKGLRLIAGEGAGYHAGGGRIELLSKHWGGAVEIHAYDGSNESTLKATVNGSLTWNSNNVLTDAVVGDVRNNSASADKTLSASTATNLISVSLPAGTWVVTGHVRYEDVTSGGKLYCVGISTTSATYSSGTEGSVATHSAGAAHLGLQPTRIISLSSTTAIYLVGYSNVTCKATAAQIRAVRIV